MTVTARSIIKPSSSPHSLSPSPLSLILPTLVTLSSLFPFHNPPCLLFTPSLSPLLSTISYSPPIFTPPLSLILLFLTPFFFLLSSLSYAPLSHTSFPSLPLSPTPHLFYFSLHPVPPHSLPSLILLLSRSSLFLLFSPNLYLPPLFSLLPHPPSSLSPSLFHSPSLILTLSFLHLSVSFPLKFPQVNLSSLLPPLHHSSLSYHPLFPLFFPLSLSFTILFSPSLPHLSSTPLPLPPFSPLLFFFSHPSTFILLPSSFALPPLLPPPLLTPPPLSFLSPPSLTAPSSSLLSPSFLPTLPFFYSPFFSPYLPLLSPSSPSFHSYSTPFPSFHSRSTPPSFTLSHSSPSFSYTTLSPSHLLSSSPLLSFPSFFAYSSRSIIKYSSPPSPSSPPKYYSTRPPKHVRLQTVSISISL